MRFNEAKATEAAAYLLNKRGGRMSYLKLIKLLYLADRKALLRWARPITTDRYVSMNKGPVVSQIYGLILEEPEPESRSFWRQYISGPVNYEVTLVNRNVPSEELSLAEEQLLDEIFDEYGHQSRWDLVDFCHRLPEWKDPCGGAIPINYGDIFRAERMSPNDIEVIEEELASLSCIDDLIPPKA